MCWHGCRFILIFLQNLLRIYFIITAEFTASLFYYYSRICWEFILTLLHNFASVNFAITAEFTVSLF